VLALAILVVFGIAYGKLVWTNRLLKKQESEDEERRIAIEESRRNEQMVETRKSQDIPFGVRAIQSGIQVDGIWISKDGTPIPASLKLGHMRKSSSKHRGSQSTSPRASIDSSPAAVNSESTRGRTIGRERESRTLLPDHRSKPIDIQYVRGYRPSYKPRRWSHLRYEGHGETNYNEETIDRLEGKERVKTRRCLRKADRAPEMENDASSGAAGDNERFSGSEIDVTLASNTKAHGQHQSLPVESSGGKSLSEIVKITSVRPLRSSLPIQSSKIEYLPVPLKPSENGKLDQIAVFLSNSDTALPFKPPYARTARELTESCESQVPLLSHSRSPTPFIPGELHMNKSIRRVNSGFEVLPAGTFGVPSEFSGRGVDRDNQTGEKRQSNKLQKNIRNSTSSGTFESP
jgi:hypothetical protein